MSETETHRNKVALTAALLVALIALAGVGYAAAHTYTGETTSSSQDIDVDYVVVSMVAADGYTAYTPATKIHAVFEKTTTTSTGTTYDGFTCDPVKYKILVGSSNDSGLWTGAANDAVTITFEGGVCSTEGFTAVYSTTIDGEYTTAHPTINVDSSGNAELFVKIKPTATGSTFSNDYKVPNATISAIKFTATAEELND